MALSDNLLVYYELEEASGTRTDSVGSQDATDNNTVTQSTGIQGNCASFASSSNEYLDSAFDPGTSIGTGDFSISLWFKTNTQNSRRSFISFSTGTDFNDFFVVGARRNTDSSNAIEAIWREGSAGQTNQTLGSGGTYQDDNWHHVIVTRTGTTATFRIDDSVQTSSTNAEFGCPFGSACTIGALAGSSLVDYMDGEIDEVGIWDRVLTGAEITELYNSGSGLSYADITAGGGGPTATFTPKVMMIT